MLTVEFAYSRLSTRPPRRLSHSLRCRTANWDAPARLHPPWYLPWITPWTPIGIIDTEFVFHSLIKTGDEVAGLALADSSPAGSPDAFIFSSVISGYCWAHRDAQPDALEKSGYGIRCSQASCESFWCREITKSHFFYKIYFVPLFFFFFAGLFITTPRLT